MLHIKIVSSQHLSVPMILPEIRFLKPYWTKSKANSALDYHILPMGERFIRFLLFYNTESM